jgi:hypothetical protein
MTFKPIIKLPHPLKTQYPKADADKPEKLIFFHGLTSTVEPLYKDTTEMRTSPLIRTPSTVPAT